MSGVDTDTLLDQLRSAAGEPELPPLRLPATVSSQRSGPIGRLLTAARAGLLRLLAPSLIDLLGQLERDRAVLLSRVRSLESRLERVDPGGGSPPSA